MCQAISERGIDRMPAGLSERRRPATRSRGDSAPARQRVVRTDERDGISHRQSSHGQRQRRTSHALGPLVQLPERICRKFFFFGCQISRSSLSLTGTTSLRCGMPMEQARCGSSPGGQHHVPAAGLTRATAHGELAPPPLRRLETELSDPWTAFNLSSDTKISSNP